MKSSLFSDHSRGIQILLLILLPAYLVMWGGGVGNYVLIGRPPLDAPWAASLFLGIAGLIVLLTTAAVERQYLVLAALIGLLAEIIGVRYGFLFSPYRYTRVLIPQLLDVPLVMLFAWMVLVAYTWHLWSPPGRFSPPAARLSRLLIRGLIPAAWMTAIDLVIDPLAANQLGYWRWVETSPYYGIPFHNFAGWFLVSLVIFLVIPPPRRQNPLATLVGLSIVIFFSVIALALRVWIPGLVGLILVTIDLSIRLRLRSAAAPDGG